jgi:hypothetical protein
MAFPTSPYGQGARILFEAMVNSQARADQRTTPRQTQGQVPTSGRFSTTGPWPSPSQPAPHGSNANHPQQSPVVPYYNTAEGRRALDREMHKHQACGLRATTADSPSPQERVQLVAHREASGRTSQTLRFPPGYFPPHWSRNESESWVRRHEGRVIRSVRRREATLPWAERTDGRWVGCRGDREGLGAAETPCRICQTRRLDRQMGSGET